MRKFINSAAMSVVLALASQTASADDNLFKSYAYGSSIHQYSEKYGYYDCTAAFNEKAMCLDDVEFINHKFSAALIFNGDKLQRVVLVTPFDHEVYMAALGALFSSFYLTIMKDSSREVDAVEMRTKLSTTDYNKKLNEFEREAFESKSLNCLFLEGIKSSEGYNTAQALLDSAPMNIRVGELVFRSEEGEAGDLMIKFEFPKLAHRDAMDTATQPVEKF